MRYSPALRLIHWGTVALVIVQISLAALNALLYEPRPVLAEWLVQTHISLGVLTFALTALRIGVRWRSPVPPRPESALLRCAAMTVHALLYVCLLALPITGYVKLAALGFTIELFGVAALPTLSLNIPVAQFAHAAHGVIGLSLGGLLILHIGAALFHRRLDGRPVLGHMAPAGRASG